MSYTLHFAPDNASLIVRIFLEEIGARYSCALVDRAKQEQSSAAYRNLNPNGLIPVLETDEGAIFETAAILLWLADRHEFGFPAPVTATRGAALKWLFFLSNTVHANLRILFYPEKYIDEKATSALRHGIQRNLIQYLQLLEAEIGPKDYLLSDTPSATDIYLCTMVRWIQLYPINETDWFDLNQFPNIQNLAKRLETRPSVLSAAKAEGLGETVFSAPIYANPQIGSAT